MYAAAPPLPHVIERAAPRAAGVIPRWEWVAAGACVVQLTEPLFSAYFVSKGIYEPQPIARLIWLPVYAFVLAMAVRDWRQALATGRRTVLLLALVAWAGLSSQWSIAPDDTIRRTIGLGLIMAFSAYLAWRYTWAQVLRLLSGSWVVLIIGAYIVALFFAPMHVMRDEHPGAWSGLWTHKNTLAATMSFGSLVLFASIAVNPKDRWWTTPALLLAIGLILFSTGKTALLALAAGVGAAMVGWGMRRGPVTMTLASAATLAITTLLAGLILLFPGLLVALIGRDMTFTGRTDIWESINHAISLRPWQGYGFGAFWVDEMGPRYWVQRDVSWKVIGAHNGWLETMLGVGKVGLALLLVQLGVTLMRAGRFILSSTAGVLAPALLAATLIYSMSESYLLGQNLYWALYTLIATKLAIAARPAPGLLADSR